MKEKKNSKSWNVQ